jgi:hypothetical protein
MLLKKSFSRAIAVSGILIVVTAIVIGPLVSPSEFSIIRHSTSEQAGQQMAGAWIMRTGFVAYGLGTAIAALSDWSTRRYVRLAFLFFGGGLIGTAVWSNASIIPGVVSDMEEDWLHSIASGVVGTAFAAGCAARLLGPGGFKRDSLSWVGLVSSVVLPIVMNTFPEFRGIFQRVMFAISFVFVTREFRE